MPNDATREAIAVVVDMLEAAKVEEGMTVFEHSAEEIGLAVMESYPAILALLADRDGQPARNTDRLDVIDRDGWRPIADAPDWEPLIVTNGEYVAMSARSEADDGTWYWAIDPEDGLDWEPTHFTYPPGQGPSRALESGAR